MEQNQNRTLLEEAQTLLSETTQAYADVRKQLSKEDRRQIKGYLSDMRKYLSRASRGSLVLPMRWTSGMGCFCCVRRLADCGSWEKVTRDSLSIKLKKQRQRKDFFIGCDKMR